MKEILSFLSQLSENNTREWFADHKSEYQSFKDQFEQLVDQLILGIQVADAGLKGLSAKKAVFRIYRDVRFSHDKSPYKTNMGAYMVAGGKKSGRGGYYIHLQPGECFIAGGIYQPLPENLKKIRREIYHFPEEFDAIIRNPELANHFRLFEKNMLKRPPKGFDPNFPYMHYLKNKHFVVTSKIEDNWLIGSDLSERLVDRFRLTVPVNEYLNRAIDHAE